MSATGPDVGVSLPRQFARTSGFTLGAPRSFTIAPDGSRVVFLRSESGTSRAQLLWVLDLADGGRASERIAAQPALLLGGAQEELSPEEKARRERNRESAAGVVAYATDDAVEVAAFALAGRLFAVDLRSGTTRELSVPTPVIDPRPSPDGRWVAYVSAGSLRVADIAGGTDRAVAEASDDQVTYGLAEFVAAEEMSRDRGYWWSPNSEHLLVARVDNSPVQVLWIADPANPASTPEQVRYPAAGTDNAEVTLVTIGLDGSQTQVDWDRETYPYLNSVSWERGRPPLLQVMSRDQRDAVILTVDTTSGQTATRQVSHDDDWLELFPGVPAWSAEGQVVQVADVDDVRALTIDDRPVTGADLQVRAVLDVSAESVLFVAAAGAGAESPEIGEAHLFRAGTDGVERVSSDPGMHTAVRAGAVMVTSSTRLDRSGARVAVVRDGIEVAEIESHAEQPVLTANPFLTLAGERDIPTAVFMPSWYEPGLGPLPVLLDPYAGPQVRVVVAAQNPHLMSQWFADQGFAVLAADGRGTPGRRPSWEKAIKNDVAQVVLDDQIDVLHALAKTHPLDLDRVAIRGWSFGGYLAGLAILRRPDVFHAAVLGAPVTDLRLYDTFYQERYLDDPGEQPEVYTANSLIGDDGLVMAADIKRPMLIIHGLADDNVLVANTLRLSSALLEAGRPHEVLPLTGVTHQVPQPQVAENMVLHELDFLARSLGKLGRPGQSAGG